MRRRANPFAPSPIAPRQGRLTLEGREVAYLLKPSPRRRTVGITVRPGGEVVVNSPARMPPGPLESILRQKAPWILAKLAEFAQAPVRPPFLWQEGETLPFQGERYPIHYCHLAGRDGLMFGNNRFWIDRVRWERAGKGQPPEDCFPQRMTRWYRAQAQAQAESRAARFAPLVGVKPTVVKVRDQKQRWGSAAQTGVIHLNWRLVLAPPGIFDYVVVHELCHLREMNHSPKFWALVAKVLPDWQARRKWLRQADLTPPWEQPAP
ncbi:MAG: M48 family metallopeptidase [Deltaproteobacteria bacterium]|nr:M48 family metallopeptidase [Deltaproteobacteria bacterium]